MRGCRKWSRAHARPDMTSPEVASPDMTSPEVVNRKWKGDNFPRVFLLGISRVFSGTPLDSRYEQWNCESNLYRFTIDLLPSMLNHFPSSIVQSVVINWLSGMCMQYMTAVSMFFCLFVCFCFRKQNVIHQTGLYTIAKRQVHFLSFIDKTMHKSLD